MVPSAGFAVAVLTNSDSGNRLASEVVGWVLDRRLGITHPEYATRELAAGDAARYAGTYRQPYASIEISAPDADLTVHITTHSPYSENSEPQTSPEFGMRYIGDGRFVVTDGELQDSQVKFWENADGTIRFLQAGGRLYVPGRWEELEGAQST